MDETTSSICPWCSAEIPAGAPACPKCGALVPGAKAVDLPVVAEPDAHASQPEETAVPDTAAPIPVPSAGSEPTTADAQIDEAAAVAPPSEAVRLEIRKMELEAEILNAGGDVMGPGEETVEVGSPSAEALAAYDAGLLDKQGPAGEDLAEAAAPWEDPELAARLAEWRAENPE